MTYSGAAGLDNAKWSVFVRQVVWQEPDPSSFVGYQAIANSSRRPLLNLHWNYMI